MSDKGEQGTQVFDEQQAPPEATAAEQEPAPNRPAPDVFTDVEEEAARPRGANTREPDAIVTDATNDPEPGPETTAPEGQGVDVAAKWEEIKQQDMPQTMESDEPAPNDESMKARFFWAMLDATGKTSGIRLRDEDARAIANVDHDGTKSITQFNDRSTFYNGPDSKQIVGAADPLSQERSAKLLVAEAKAEGWEKIKIDGADDKLKDQIWLEAQKQGVKTTGHKASRSIIRQWDALKKANPGKGFGDFPYEQGPRFEIPNPGLAQAEVSPDTSPDPAPEATQPPAEPPTEPPAEAPAETPAEPAKAEAAGVTETVAERTTEETIDKTPAGAELTAQTPATETPAVETPAGEAPAVDPARALETGRPTLALETGDPEPQPTPETGPSALPGADAEPEPVRTERIPGTGGEDGPQVYFDANENTAKIATAWRDELGFDNEKIRNGLSGVTALMTDAVTGDNPSAGLQNANEFLQGNAALTGEGRATFRDYLEKAGLDGAKGEPEKVINTIGKQLGIDPTATEPRADDIRADASTSLRVDRLGDATGPNPDTTDLAVVDPKPADVINIADHMGGRSLTAAEPMRALTTGPDAAAGSPQAPSTRDLIKQGITTLATAGAHALAEQLEKRVAGKTGGVAGPDADGGSTALAVVNPDRIRAFKDRKAETTALANFENTTGVALGGDDAGPRQPQLETRKVAGYLPGPSKKA